MQESFGKPDSNPVRTREKIKVWDAIPAPVRMTRGEKREDRRDEYLDGMYGQGWLYDIGREG